MYFGDSLTTAFASISARFGWGRTPQAPLEIGLTHHFAVQAYLSSGMLRKCIRIPAADRTAKWRDWQADSDAIGKIEAEEKRLGLRAKVKQAEILRGLGGGALILSQEAPADHSMPLLASSMGPGRLAAINVASRWQLECLDWDKDLASPTYGQPRMFELKGGDQNINRKIHPSRVITFRGDALPVGGNVTMEEAFWGDSRLSAVLREVTRSDEVNGWFAALVRKAKITRYGIPGLSERMAQPDGQKRINDRIAAIAEGENITNAAVYESGAGDYPGETITDYQVTWAGIPAVMDAFDQRVSAVSDIPFTRLMGRSPAGMNATGQHDLDNWWTAVSDGQENELRPCLEALDPLLLASAGVPADGVTWTFAPLSTPSEAERATTFKTTMEALTALKTMAIMPEEALNEAAQNLLLENETLPGLESILNDIPDDERYGVDPAADPSLGDPSALTEPQARGGDLPVSPTARGPGATGAPARAANDAKPIPLYVQRKLLNAAELIAWAKEQGFTSTLAADDMHVTVLYSRNPVDPIKMGETWSGDDKGNLTIKPGGPRAVEKLGESAVVLMFASSDLAYRHQSMVEAGASHDFAEYQPHVTLTYEAGDVDLEAIKPFAGKLVFGPEIFEPLDLDWKSKIKED